MSPLAPITADPQQCGGRLYIRDTRIRASDVLGLLAEGLSEDEVLTDHSAMEREAIWAVPLFAARLLPNRSLG